MVFRYNLFQWDRQRKIQDNSYMCLHCFAIPRKSEVQFEYGRLKLIHFLKFIIYYE